MGIMVCSSRTLLFILGFLFLAATVAVWGLSGYMLATYKQINTFASAHFAWVPAVVMILVGIVFLVAGVSGCLTACGQKRLCSFIFFLFVFITFVALISTTALLFVYKRQINAAVNEDTNVTFSQYDEPGQELLTRQVDFVQSHLQCCGGENYTSWENTYWAQRNRTHRVPLSCCKKNIKDCKNGNLELMKPIDNFIYTDGCVEKVDEFLQTQLRYLAGGTIAFLLILMVGMIASCVVFCKREANPYFSLD